MLFALERRATRGALTTVREQTGASDAEALAEDAHLAEGDPRALRAMARAWEALDATPANEAMRLYVKVLDEEKPNWWDGAATEARRSNRGMHAKGGMEALPEAMRVERGRWEFLEYAGTKPTARFQHAATVAGREDVRHRGIVSRTIHERHARARFDDVDVAAVEDEAGDERVTGVRGASGGDVSRRRLRRRRPVQGTGDERDVGVQDGNERRWIRRSGMGQD